MDIFDARMNFQANPSVTTAQAYLDTAYEYCQDGMGDEGLVKEVLDHLGVWRWKLRINEGTPEEEIASLERRRIHRALPTRAPSSAPQMSAPLRFFIAAVGCIVLGVAGAFLVEAALSGLGLGPHWPLQR
jgi:hypothetical protein